MNISMSQDLFLLNTQYIHASNWTWNENFLPLCIHGLNMIKSPHERLQYFSYLRRFYTWA
jgi:hypothetical protein